MKVGIIGGGASGIMAAITAARYGAKQGAQITIIEKNARIGKKILATGNGKCNFTNKTVNNSDYYSQYTKVFNDYISQFNEKQVISFFKNEGMLVKEKNGYFYPRSEQASAVLDVLRRKLEEYKVIIHTEACPVLVAGVKNGFEVTLSDKKKLFFHRLILACGSFAGQRKKEGYSGYDYAVSLGHTIVPVVPALVQLRAKPEMQGAFKAIAGVRCDVAVSVFIDGKKCSTEFGELQLTDYGISGIPVFQLSRHAAYGFLEKRKVMAVIDFLPEFTKDEIKAFLKKKWDGRSADTTVEAFFLGILNKKLNHLFIRLAGMKAGQPVDTYSFSRLLNTCLGMKEWKVELGGTNSFEHAQVCAGGVSLKEITLHMESKIKKGLFFAGEMLDVDGRCGGYNLQWAWTSGYLAGKYAVSGQSENQCTGTPVSARFH